MNTVIGQPVCGNDSRAAREEDARSGEVFDLLQAEQDRRLAVGDGCGRCCYCDLGVPNLCRHYDLSLAWKAAEDAGHVPPEASTSSEPAQPTKPPSS